VTAVHNKEINTVTNNSLLECEFLKQGYVKIQTYSSQSHTDYKVTYSLMSLIKINNKACEKQIKTGSAVCVWRLVFAISTLFDAPSWGTPCDIKAIYTLLKSTFSGLQFRRWQYGSVFIRLAVIASETQKCRGIPIKFDLTAVQGHPRSSILVSIESPHVTSY